MSAPSTKTMLRKPSHFGSYTQPVPAGKVFAVRASWGRRGGLRGSAMAATLVALGERGMLAEAGTILGGEQRAHSQRGDEDESDHASIIALVADCYSLG